VDRKITSMSEAAVAADFRQSLDVERDFASEVALDLVLPINDLADAGNLVLGQIPHSRVWADLGRLQDCPARCRADAVDVGESDLNALVSRNVDPSYTCHMPLYPCFCLCRGSVQITIMTPRRRIIRHLSQRRFTDADTFICPSSFAPQASPVPSRPRVSGRTWVVYRIARLDDEPMP
jgi:hypothetical protein